MSSVVVSSESGQSQAVAVLADALERLGARITRDLNVEAGEGAAPEDPRWADTLSGFVTFADQCLGVLDDPRVISALAAGVGIGGRI